ncbi:uncharacterized protein LOC117177227 [Belonocnema kinseyi]|uniref:uncharacterized protein LOC117177227 n=1 Tax=Belonocnema kinseyi TaxID=2817044 RepID=UPI00143D72FB|nr:uncharacterized protein LOC117177227 [Belonocnema kinseyi]
MVEKTTPGSSDRGPNSNHKYYPNPYQNYNPCDSYYRHPPHQPGPTYPHNYQSPCPCQSRNVPSFCTHEVENEIKKSGCFKLSIVLFILFVVSIIITYNYIRGLLSQSNTNVSGRANQTFSLNQNPQSAVIGAQTLRIGKRDAYQNCPAEFTYCNNEIIKPSPSREEADSPRTSSPGQIISRRNVMDGRHRTQIENVSVETSFAKPPNSQEHSSKSNKKSTGTLMTDDEKSAFLQNP